MSNLPNPKTFSSGGGFAAQHKVPRTLPIFVAPTVTDELNTVRVALVAIACWRVNHVLFGFDSSFVVPEIREELKDLAALVRANPESPASVFGHADPVGDDDFNKPLSGRRAQAIFGLLTRNVDLWEELHRDSHGADDWGLKSIQVILKHLVSASGDPFYAGAIDGINGSGTKDGVRGFQRENGLGVDGVAGPATRKLLFRAYMDSICLGPDDSFVMLPEAFLGKGQDAAGKGAMQGCSEFNPVVVFSQKTTSDFARETDKTERNAKNAPNRRVMVFLFRAGSKISPEDWPCPRVKEGVADCKKQFWPDGNTRRQSSDEDREYRITRNTMACRFYDKFARLSPCEGVVAALVRIRLFDKFAKPMQSVAFEADFAGVTEKGNAVGSFAVLHNVAVPGTVRIRWNKLPARKGAPATARPVFEYEMDVFVDVRQGEREEVARRKLSNLGYSLGTTLADNIKAFQVDASLDPTGKLDDAEDEINRRHDRALPRDVK